MILIMCSILVTGCSTKTEQQVATQTTYKVAEPNKNKFVPKSIPEFEYYAGDVEADKEFAIYKQYKYNDTMTEEEILHIRNKETVVEPVYTVSTNSNIKLYDKRFDNVGEAFPGKYTIVGYYDTWVHIVDSKQQTAWVDKNELISAVDEDFAHNIKARPSDTMDPELAMSSLETITWSPDIIVLKDSICYVFPAGTYTFKGNDKNITIKYNDIMNSYKLGEQTITLLDNTEVYADFGTEVITDVKVSANMVSE